METKNILSLSSEEAMSFFLQSSQYHTFELPEYFDFSKVLEYVRDSVKDREYEDCIAGTTPDEMSNVNLDIILNKDGRYAVRPITLANPFLYYFLVREICNDEGWTKVQQLFEKFTVPNITSCALPIIPAAKEAFYKSTTILNWWNSMEQRAIELSLEYRYMFVTDITNCYGSINPQAFDWTFNLKSTKYESSSESKIAKNIQKYLRAMQQGRNVGIPQGSVIFDFVGEIILGYSDLLLHEALQAKSEEYKKKGAAFPKYEIIRYRDDYRVFCNDKDALEEISYILQQVLESLNFRMNSQKTRICNSIVTDAVKSDKLAYIYNTPIFNKKGCDFDSFEKHLLYILMFARQYPDSGSVRIMLSDLDKRVADYLKPYEEEVFTLDGEDGLKAKKVMKQRILSGGTVRAMAAICTQIALENVNNVQYALRVMSRMVESLKDEDEKWDIRNKVCEKLCNQPNSSYNQLWLQNITFQHDLKEGRSPYTMRLCRVAAGDEDVQLWNNDWIKSSLRDDLPVSLIVDKETLEKVTPIITFRETRMYYEGVEVIAEL